MADPVLDIVLGWDAREHRAYQIAEFSILRRTSRPVRISPLRLADARMAGIYTRPTTHQGNQLWDVISGAPMSTEFALTRFLIPSMKKWRSKWVLFADCDILCLRDITSILYYADPSKAVMVVKHDHKPAETLKMDGVQQTSYPRKNWSSVILWNIAHPKNRALTSEQVNTLPGRDLHAFCWLDDDDIGELPPEWNVLVGAEPLPMATNPILHYTLGGPWLPGWAGGPLDDLWGREAAIYDHWYETRRTCHEIW